MIKTGESIWGTFEMYCASADFSYENDYLPLHKRSNIRGTPLSKAGYEAFCKVIHMEIEEDHKNANKD